MVDPRKRSNVLQNVILLVIFAERTVFPLVAMIAMQKEDVEFNVDFNSKTRLARLAPENLFRFVKEIAFQNVIRNVTSVIMKNAFWFVLVNVFVDVITEQLEHVLKSHKHHYVFANLAVLAQFVRFFQLVVVNVLRM